MAYTVTDYTTLTQKLNQTFNEGAASQIEGWVGAKIFDVIDTDWKVYNYLDVYGTAGFGRVAEGQQLPIVTSQEGDSANFTQKRYGSRIAITKDLRLFERYNEMVSIVQSEVDGAFHKIDQSMADVLTNGFTGTSYTDVYGDSVSNLANDGVVLFSPSHTNNINANTYRNLIRNSAGTTNPALDRDPIVKARSDAMTFRDPSGVVRPTTLDTLIVSAANEDLANRIVFSSGVQGTPNVDTNPVRGWIKTIIPWAKLDTRSDGTDTSAYWFLADSKMVKKSLLAPFAQKPQMGEATNVHDTLDWEYPVDAYYTLGIGKPRFIFGSTGAN